MLPAETSSPGSSLALLKPSPPPRGRIPHGCPDEQIAEMLGNLRTLETAQTHKTVIASLCFLLTYILVCSRHQTLRKMIKIYNKNSIQRTLVMLTERYNLRV